MNDNTGTALPGTYLLLLQCKQNEQLAVGKLGEFEILPGYYLYVGSAFGPGGVQARMNHHRKIASRPHWHIDYLRKFCELSESWCIYQQRREHDWAKRLSDDASFTVPLTGFGSSDCNCATHLFHVNNKPTKHSLQIVLGVELNTI